MFYSQQHQWASANGKLARSFRYFVYSLRSLFPERFQRGISPEFAMAISSGDSPGVKVSECLLHGQGHCGDGLPPILQFGSAYQEIFPSMIAMPMPSSHLPCFHRWTKFGTVCEDLQPKIPPDGQGELVFGEEFGLAWDDLIPQLVWRGTDFLFLGRVYPLLR